MVDLKSDPTPNLWRHEPDHEETGPGEFNHWHPMQSYIYLAYLSDFFQILIGFVVVAFAGTWRRQSGKPVFIAFAVMALIVIPASHLLFSVVMNGWMIPGRRLGFRQVLMVQPIFVGFCYLVSGALLLSYAVIRSRESVFDSNSAASRSPGELSALSSPSSLWDPAGGPRWSTAISGGDLVSIARRREWGFLIDLSPTMFLALGISLMASEFGGNQIFSRLGAGILIGFWIGAPFLMIYWVLKDSFAGVSFGKWITGCRVVDAVTGKPIGAQQSFLRNFLFLIPLALLIEVFVASIRSDRRRVGDLIAGTLVVKGPPKWVDGVEVEPQKANKEPAPARHPLDD